jgi:intermembrane space import and assembly protein 40
MLKLTIYSDPHILHVESQPEPDNLPTIETLAAERKQRLESTSPPPLGSETPSANAAQLEEEAGQQGAFNPETGEINWDCPCLGGMAHGPCGDEFKAAFSCFVFSEADPKGMDCIDKFK